MKNENVNNEEDRFGEVLRVVENGEGPDEAFLAGLREESAGVFREACGDVGVLKSEVPRAFGPTGLTESGSVPLGKTRGNSLGMRRLFGWGAPLTTAAVLLLAVVFWPGDPVASLAWADVVAEVGGAKSVYIKFVNSREDGDTINQIYLRDINLARVIEDRTGDSDPPSHSIFNRKTKELIEWNETTGLYRRENLNGRTSSSMDMILVILMHMGWPGDGTGVGVVDTELNLPMTGGRAEVLVLEAAMDGGRLKNRFSFQIFAKMGDKEQPLFPKAMTLWINPDDNRVERAVVQSPENDFDVEMFFDFDPQLSDDLFEPPVGYVDVDAALRDRLNVEVREVFDAVEAARADFFTGYVALSWVEFYGGGTVPSPRYREVRRGEAWRYDQFDTSKVSFRNTDEWEFSGPDQEFGDVWRQVGAIDTPLRYTRMPHDNYIGWITYDNHVRGSIRSSTLYHADSSNVHRDWALQSSTKYRLEAYAWPVWMTYENTLRGGEIINGKQVEEWNRDIRFPQLHWEKLPADVDRPGLVGVRGSRDAKNFFEYEYWFDPQHDWICIERIEQEDLRERRYLVKAMGQTEDGKWYPTIVGGNSMGGLRVFRASRAIDAVEGLLDWPEGVPVNGTTAISVDEITVESTLEGSRKRYLATNDYGYLKSERELIGQKNRKQYELMRERMKGIVKAKDAFVKKHERRKWPRGLQILIDEGFLDEGDAVNPLDGAGRRFGFIRDGGVPLLHVYEDFEEWPGVVTVVFSTGEVQHVHDEVEFEALKEEVKVSLAKRAAENAARKAKAAKKKEADEIGV